MLAELLILSLLLYIASIFIEKKLLLKAHAKASFEGKKVVITGASSGIGK
jgi:short-subunit dehydrogenase